MKKLKEVLKENEQYKPLINAVIKNIGLNSVQDVIRNGADAGFSGFIYYYETHKFALKYRKYILELLKYYAGELGEDEVQIVSNFGIFRDNLMDAEDKRELYKYLGGAKCEQSTITNIMAWFALEEVCNFFDN